MRGAEQMLPHGVHRGKQIKKKTDYLLLIVVCQIIEILVYTHANRDEVLGVTWRSDL